ncbi:putative membrane protein [Halapricum desulfuricans]|uniref:Putative membrane protein n=2 Tax=Halapricum desulfuricans TaxID=2841257 RepID=A0A897NKD1_9EURY|nr:putative membrane protein [Halapricum desulfuricans]
MVGQVACMGNGDTLLNAVVGAVVTVLASFIPFSPVLGGAVAGYLQKEDSSTALKVGALSGAIAAIPFLFVVALLGSVLPFLPAFFDGPGAFAGIFVVFAIFAILASVVYTVGLSAIGGYLGWYLESETDL